jgi:hypothetical protein
MESVRAVAAGVAALRDRWGDDVVAGEPVELSGSGRSVVLRVPLSGRAASVIVKGYDPPADSAGFDPLENEAVAGELFGTLPGPPVGPELLAADLSRRVLVFSDLGDHPALSDVLLGSDPDAAEQGLLTWARGLGQIAARTRDPWPRVAQIQAELGISHRDNPIAGSIRVELGEIVELAGARYGIEARAGLDRDLAVATSLLDRSAYDIFSPADACPDNNQLTPNGSRFFDFEFAGCCSLFRDAAYTVAPFPTCWCVLDMPVAMTNRVETAYRDEVLPTFPELADDDIWYDGLIRASALYTIRRVGSMLRRPPGELDAGSFEEHGVLFPGAAVEVHFRLGRLLALDRGVIPSLMDFLRDIDGRLVAEFGEAALAMPAYPAFTGLPA